MSHFILWFVKLTGFIPGLFYFRKRIIYVNKDKQKRKIKGKAILVSNHTSVYDFALYMYVFLFRDIRVLSAKILYRKNKIFSWFLDKIGCIKVDRYSYDFNFLSKCLYHLGKNRVIEIYPEGRLARSGEERPLEFKPSFVYLALESGAPIIPLYTSGNYGKGKTKVVIGEPIDLKALYNKDLDEKENINYLCNYVRDVIISLGDKVNEERGEKDK